MIDLDPDAISTGQELLRLPSYAWDSGAVLGDFKGEAAGVGSALMWATKIKDMDLIVNAQWLRESDAEHRLEGDHLFLNLTIVGL